MSKNIKDNLTPKKITKVAEVKMAGRQLESHNKRFDRVKMLIAFLILAASIVAFYYFSDLPGWLRSVFPLVGVIIFVSIVFFWCAFGKNLIVYVRESTQELRKVVWPDKKTTTQMTIMVLVFSGVLALFIWLVDSIISWLFSLYF